MNTLREPMNAVSLRHDSPQVVSARLAGRYRRLMARRQHNGSSGDEHPDDKALDRLADRGPSRVGLDGALRARDVSRPSQADRARAERSVTIRKAPPVSP